MYEQVSKNKRNSYLLIFSFLVIIMVLGYILGYIFATATFGLLVAFIISLIMILIGYYSGDKLILAMSNAKEVTKKDDPYLVNTVEGLAIASGIPTPKVYIIQENSMNAFATGRDYKHASVTVTSGLRKNMNREELEGVIAHELSHIKNYDVRLMMLIAILVGIIALLSDFLLRSFLWSPRQKHQRGSGGILIIAVLIGAILAILAPLIAQLIKFAVSRQREYLADADGALLNRNPHGLANALKKIKNDKDKMVDTANKATAHLYIENPLRNLGGNFNNLFSTHPPIDSRIKRLEEMY
ncbi:zinc metalloprotease HtpX [Candidatus Woesearchaeota archaeon]|nr:zinc metalloprotease HtpX [Candidatus Woesearchaeota archaeon]